MTSLVLNQELNGVEVYFDSKPAGNILENLKSNGFRWSGYKKCWYAKQNENTLKLAEAVASNQLDQVAEQTEQTIIKPVKPITVKKSMSLWDLTRWEDQNNLDKKLSTKDIAASIRKHVKSRFPMCKFSVTSSYNSISFYICSSPYEKESQHLQAVKDYCTKLIESYKYCTSYDPYGDYGSSYNFYGSYAKIDYDYTQTEQTEAIKADIIDFDKKLAEFNRLEEDRKELEYQARIKELEAEKEAYQIRLAEEKEQIKAINNSVKAVDLDEKEQYFVLKSPFAKLNKNNTLDQYKEEVTKGEYYPENVKITREIHFQTAETLEYFSNLLLTDFDFLTGTGGSYTDDLRINSMIDFDHMDKEERNTVNWNLYGVAVYFNNELQFVVNTEGSSYSRYVGLADNVTITKDFAHDQVISQEELDQLKAKADTLTDLSVEVIIENNLVNTWKTTTWETYKNAMKNKLKAFNFRLNKSIIQQLPGDQAELKLAMYRLLVEVDGIQEQFNDANIKQGQKITLFYMSDFGGIITRRITFDSVENSKYAQYNNAVKLTFKPENKKKLYYSHFYSEILVYNGCLDLPVNVLHNVESRNGFTVTSTKYGSCDKKQYDEILNHFAVDGKKPIINTYKPMF